MIRLLDATHEKNISDKNQMFGLSNLQQRANDLMVLLIDKTDLVYKVDLQKYTEYRR